MFLLFEFMCGTPPLKVVILIMFFLNMMDCLLCSLLLFTWECWMGRGDHSLTVLLIGVFGIEGTAQ